jgi:Lipocalin-like domain
VKRCFAFATTKVPFDSCLSRAYQQKLPAIALLSVVLALFADGAAAQQKTLKDELVGSWKFISSTSQRDDGSATWGPNPKGLLIFTEGGRFSLQIMRSDRPRYKSNTRIRGSLIENQATTRGALSYFAAYAVNEPDRVLTFHIESSSFPNLNDSDQKRVVTFAGDSLKLENLVPSRGSGSTFQLWERAK